MPPAYSLPNWSYANMSARNKLNSMFLLGSIVVAGIVGLQTGSVLVFLGLAVLLVGCSIGFGGIRLEQKPW